MSSKQKKSKPLRLILRYAAEVLIIFLGITISFLFDRWREDRQKREDLIELSQSLMMDIGGLKTKLIEERGGSETWIRQLDSLRSQRITNSTTERQLFWFYRLITGQIAFLFESHSPTYLSAANSSLYAELPDSLKNDLYTLYQVRLPFFQLLYNQQGENVTHFRNNVVVTSGADLYHQDATQLRPDLKKLAQELQRPAYGNFINQVIILEREVYALNESNTKYLTVLEKSLLNYITELKDE